MNNQFLLELETKILELLSEHKDGLTPTFLFDKLPEKFCTPKLVRKLIKELLHQKKITRRKDRLVLRHQPQTRDLPKVSRGLTGELTPGKNKTLLFLSATLQEPVIIFPEHSNNALPGDEVQIILQNRKQRGQLVGTVTTILKRTGFEFLFCLRNKKIYTKNSFPLPIEIDLPENMKENSWHKARVNETIHPQRIQATYLEKISDHSDPDLESILTDFALVREFPEKLNSCDFSSLTDQSPRTDLKSLNTFTIDGADARDFDDAISILFEEQIYTLFVHIADVAHFVTQKSELDQEAQRRSTSVYFPGTVIPMLPEILSNKLCSLKPNESRYALSVKMQIDAHGNLKNASLFPSEICSNFRFTYDHAFLVLTTEEHELKKDLLHCLNLSRILKRKRMAEGSLDFDLEETKIMINSKHEVLGIETQKRLPTHEMIEEFMLMANRVIAQFMKIANLPCLYRHHPKPLVKDLEQLREILLPLGIRGKKRLDSPGSLQELISDAASKGLNFILPLAVRAMAKAIYHETNSDHFGLGFPFYCHFTSPIRRYPDLLVHRSLKTLLSSLQVKELQIFPYQRQNFFSYSLGNLNRLSQLASMKEKAAEQAERLYKTKKMIQWGDKHLNQTCMAQVASMNHGGMFLLCKNPVLELFMELDSLGAAWKIHEDSMVCQNDRTDECIYLGETLEVTISKTDKERNRVIVLPGKALKERLSKVPDFPKKHPKRRTYTRI